MKLGAWIHDFGMEAGVVREQFRSAARCGLSGVRSYGVDYSERVAPWLAEDGLSLVAGIHVDERALVADWRSQVKLDELERTASLGCRLEAICVGNELREGGDAWESKRFTARLSYSLARVLEEYRRWLVDALDVMASRGKKLLLSEMGFPSGVGYRIDGTIDGKDHVRPVSDTAAFGDRMAEYVDLLALASRDYDGLLEAAYFYEWWDNHRHSKIWNIEQSPIHTCFGLCDDEGTPKLDIADLVRRAR